MSADAPPSASTATRSTVDDLDIAYRVRGSDRAVLRDVSFRIGRGESFGLVGESGCGKSTVALALVDYLPRNGRVTRRLDRDRRPRPLRAERARRCAQLRASTVSMVYQDPRARSTRRSASAARWRRCSRSPGQRARRRSSGPRRRCGGCGSPTRQRDGALPASALGRHAAARRDRDGAGGRAGAADPGRADHRPRRHGRGGGARPGRGAARGVSTVAALHQPQPRRDRQDVRSRRRAVRRRAGRGGPGARGVHDPRHPYTVGLLRCIPRRGRRRTRAAGHHPGFPAAAGRDAPGLHLRRPLRARRGSLPRRAAADVRGRAGRGVALPFPRAGAPICPGPTPGEPDGRAGRARAASRCSAPATSARRSASPARRARAGRCRLEIRAGETLGLVGESGSGKTTLARRAARASSHRTRARRSRSTARRSRRTTAQAHRASRSRRCRSCSRTPTRRSTGGTACAGWSAARCPSSPACAARRATSGCSS